MSATLKEEKTFEELFEEIQNDIQDDLEIAESIDTFKAKKPKYDGDVSFQLDKNGNYKYEIVKAAWGVLLTVEAYIKEPDDTYDISVKSNKSGGGNWKNIKPFAKERCELKTFLGAKETTITISIHAHKKTNTRGVAHITVWLGHVK